MVEEAQIPTSHSVGGQRSLRVIAVTSGKGDVGKSSIIINLGIAFAQSGRKVLLIDGDLGLGNVDILMHETPQFTLHHVLEGKKTMDDVLLHSRYGVTVLPATSGVAEMASLSEEQRMRLVNAMDDLEADFDTVLVDTAAGIGSNALFFASAAQEVLVVVTPEPTSLADAYAMIKLLSLRCGVKRVGIVVNQTANSEEAHGIFQRLSTLATRFLPVMLELVGTVPLDSVVRSAVREQRPFTIEAPQAKASMAVQRLANSLLMRPSRPGATTGRVQLFWRRLLDVSMEAPETLNR